MMTSREYAEHEFEKASRHTREHDTLVLTAAAAAGWLLASADGDVERAIALSPTGKFWTGVVRRVLETIKQEEVKKNGNS